MTLTIELTPGEEARLMASAKQRGIAPQECIRQLLATYLPTIPNNTADEDPTLALFAKWEQEDAEKPLEEITAEEQLWEEFERGINGVRQVAGMRQL